MSFPLQPTKRCKRLVSFPGLNLLLCPYLGDSWVSGMGRLSDLDTSFQFMTCQMVAIRCHKPISHFMDLEHETGMQPTPLEQMLLGGFSWGCLLDAEHTGCDQRPSSTLSWTYGALKSAK